MGAELEERPVGVEDHSQQQHHDQRQQGPAGRARQPLHDSAAAQDCFESIALVTELCHLDCVFPWPLPAPSRPSPVPGELCRHPPTVHHDDPIAHRQQLGHFRRDQQNRDSLGGPLIHQRVDLPFGAHVDAAGRFVQQQELSDAVRIHLARATFCWLPPESSRHLHVQRGCPQCSDGSHLLGGRALRTRQPPAAGREAFQLGQRGVGHDRHRQDQPGRLAVVGQQAMPRRMARRGDPGRSGRPSSVTLPGSFAAVCAEEAHQADRCCPSPAARPIRQSRRPAPTATRC